MAAGATDPRLDTAPGEHTPTFSIDLLDDAGDPFPDGDINSASLTVTHDPTGIDVVDAADMSVDTSGAAPRASYSFGEGEAFSIERTGSHTTTVIVATPDGDHTVPSDGDLTIRSGDTPGVQQLSIDGSGLERGLAARDAGRTATIVDYDSLEVTTAAITNATIQDASLDSIDVGESTITDSLTAEGPVTINSTLDVVEATTLDSTLDVTGAVTLESTLDVTDAVTLESTLDVTDAVTIDSTLDVTDVIGLVEPDGSGTNPQLDFRNGYQLYSDDTGAGSTGTRLWIGSNDGGELSFGPRSGGNYSDLFRVKTREWRVNTNNGPVFTIDNGGLFEDDDRMATRPWVEDGPDFTGVVKFADPDGAGTNQQLDFRNGYGIYSDDAGSGDTGTRLWVDANNRGEMVFGPRASGDYNDNFRVLSREFSFDAPSTSLSIDNNGVHADVFTSNEGIVVEGGTRSEYPSITAGPDHSSGSLTLESNNEANGGHLFLNREDPGHVYLASGGGNVRAGGGGDIHLAYSGDGSVGIGTASPSYQLEVDGDANVTGQLMEGTNRVATRAWADGANIDIAGSADQWDSYDLQKNGSDTTGVVNFKT